MKLNKLVLGAVAASLLCVASANGNLLTTGTVTDYETGEACLWIKLDSAPAHYFTVANRLLLHGEAARNNFEAMRDQLLSAYRYGDLVTIEQDSIPDVDCYDAGGSRIIDIRMVHPS